MDTPRDTVALTRHDDTMTCDFQKMVKKEIWHVRWTHIEEKYLFNFVFSVYFVGKCSCLDVNQKLLIVRMCFWHSSDSA